MQENIYFPALGYTGWVDLPVEDEESDCDKDPDAKAGEKTPGTEWESVDVVALNGPLGARLFVRGQEPGLIQQGIRPVLIKGNLVVRPLLVDEIRAR